LSKNIEIDYFNSLLNSLENRFDTKAAEFAAILRQIP
jgi:hypothetical protein